jgi:Na+/H+-dicarboxylate symporter
MGRTATNVIGNSLACAVIGRWEGERGATIEDTTGEVRAT